MRRVGVIGAGAWGTTLAVLLAEKGVRVSLWTSKLSRYEALKRDRENSRYLPGVELPHEITPTVSLEETASAKDFLLLAVPSHAFREILERLAPFLQPRSLLVSATKGLELPEGLTMSQVTKAVLPFSHFAVLSGPSFAKEVSQRLPTAVVVASEELEGAASVRELLTTPFFRIYLSRDPLGVELAGALKNVIAIAAGIADGLRLGYNARAALLARGLAEIARLGVAMGAEARTFAGLAGVGDLILTATSDFSRNRQVGLMLAKGIPLDEILATLGQVAEGVNTARAVMNLAKRYRVEIPICREVYAVLFEGKEPRQALDTLLLRSPRVEEWPF